MQTIKWQRNRAKRRKWFQVWEQVQTLTNAMSGTHFIVLSYALSSRIVKDLEAWF